MGYTFYDLLDKLADIEESEYRLYRQISEIKGIPVTIGSTARELADQKQKQLQYYREIQDNFSKPENNPEIDFTIYDKASGLIIGFRNQYLKPGTRNLTNLAHFALECEKANKALLLSIQGLFVHNNPQANAVQYEFMEKLINNKELEIKNIMNSEK